MDGVASRLPSPLRRMLSGETAGGLARLSGAELVALVAALLSNVVVARSLGPAGYGLLALAWAIPTFVFTVLDPQASEAVVRFLPPALDQRDGPTIGLTLRLCYRAESVLSALGLVVMLALCVPLADVFMGDPDDASLLIIGALTLALTGPSRTARGALIASGCFGVVARIRIGEAVARSAALVLA